MYHLKESIPHLCSYHDDKMWQKYENCPKAIISSDFIEIDFLKNFAPYVWEITYICIQNVDREINYQRRMSSHIWHMVGGLI